VQVSTSKLVRRRSGRRREERRDEKIPERKKKEKGERKMVKRDLEKKTHLLSSTIDKKEKETKEKNIIEICNTTHIT
jgi:hypothetical protein